MTTHTENTIAQIPATPFADSLLEKKTIRSFISSYLYLNHHEQEQLEEYFIRKWFRTYLLNQIKDGTLTYEGTKYQIVWYKGKSEACKLPEVILSFRKSHFPDIAPVVMIGNFDPNNTSAKK